MDHLGSRLRGLFPVDPPQGRCIPLGLASPTTPRRTRTPRAIIWRQDSSSTQLGTGETSQTSAMAEQVSTAPPSSSAYRALCSGQMASKTTSPTIWDVPAASSTSIHSARELTWVPHLDRGMGFRDPVARSTHAQQREAGNPLGVSLASRQASSTMEALSM